MVLTGMDACRASSLYRLWCGCLWCSQFHCVPCMMMRTLQVRSMLKPDSAKYKPLQPYTILTHSQYNSLATKGSHVATCLSLLLLTYGCKIHDISSLTHFWAPFLLACNLYVAAVYTELPSAWHDMAPTRHCQVALHCLQLCPIAAAIRQYCRSQ